MITVRMSVNGRANGKDSWVASAMVNSDRFSDRLRRVGSKISVLYTYDEVLARIGNTLATDPDDDTILSLGIAALWSACRHADQGPAIEAEVTRGLAAAGQATIDWQLDMVAGELTVYANRC
jgi:hypothetical protein